MTRKLIQTKATTLSYGINDSATSMRLQNLLKLDGSSISASDIGEVLYGTFDPGTSREEIFSISGDYVTVNDDGTIDITNIVRGLKEVDPYNTGGFAIDHPAGGVVIFGNNPQLYNGMAFLANDNIFLGYNEAPDPLTAQGLVTRDWILALINGGTVTTSYVVVPGTAGETISAGELLYFKNADGSWYKTDGTDDATLIGVKLGIAQGAGTNGNPITGGVMLYGDDTNQSGMSVGAKQYASDTPGDISATPGTFSRTIGVARTSSILHFDPYFEMPSNSSKPIITVPAISKAVPSSTSEGYSETTEFNITNPVGTTFRYTYSGTGTNPDINSGTVSVGQSVHINGENFNSGNNVDALVTGVGANYFEIDNSSGVVESAVALGHGRLMWFNSWQKLPGLQWIRVRQVGGGGAGGSADGASTNNSCACGGGAGGYTENVANASELDDVMLVIRGDFGLYSVDNTGGDGYSAKSSRFGDWEALGGPGGGGDDAAIGGIPASQLTPSTGDVNIPGGSGHRGIFTSSTNGIKGGDGGDSFFGGGEDGGNSEGSGGSKAPGSGGAGGFSEGGNATYGEPGALGLIIIEEYY